MKKEVGIFTLLVVLCGVTGLKNHAFFSEANLMNTANLIGLYGIFSIGIGLVIITGGIDLSVGSMIALNGMLLVLALTEWHWTWPLAAAFALAVPMLLGLGHGLPMPFVFLIVIAAIMWVVLHRSVYGRYLFAVGRNEEATRFSGINTRGVIAGAYILAGLLTGISGILFAFYTNSISPSMHGNFYELYGIAAAVLGGCSLRGGEGSIAGILIGTALLLVLQNLVNLLGIDSSLNFAVMGAVVLLGVLADQIFQNRAAKRIARQPR
jgi:ribose transport system permease protein